MRKTEGAGTEGQGKEPVKIGKKIERADKKRKARKADESEEREEKPSKATRRKDKQRRKESGSFQRRQMHMDANTRDCWT